MWVAKADLVPTDANLVEEYVDWPELAAACEEFMASVNGGSGEVARLGPVAAVSVRKSTRPVPGGRWAPTSGATPTGVGPSSSSASERRSQPVAFWGGYAHTSGKGGVT